MSFIMMILCVSDRLVLLLLLLIIIIIMIIVMIIIITIISIMIIIIEIVLFQFIISRLVNSWPPRWGEWTHKLLYNENVFFDEKRYVVCGKGFRKLMFKLLIWYIARNRLTVNILTIDIFTIYMLLISGQLID